MRQKTRIVSIALSIILAAPAFAADLSQWNNLRALQRGDRIRIVQTNQTALEGRFDSVNDAAITIETSGPTRIAKSDVMRVLRRKGMSRKKRTLIGAAVGIGGGAIAAAALGASSNNEGWFAGPAGGIMTVITVGGGALVGTTIGAFSGGGYKTVYRLATSKH